ncbi:MAG: hypothetical protein IMW91_11035 [Firmicutes bacterium]|nr:hypothetical protein [Bacillota bacterium]
MRGSVRKIGRSFVIGVLSVSMVSAGIAVSDHPAKAAQSSATTRVSDPAQSAAMNSTLPGIVIATTASQKSPDEQLNEIISKLDGLPDSLKNADPKTTPNYEEKLNEALGGITVVQGVEPGRYTTLSIWTCTLAVAGLVAQYGFPVARVLKWIKEAKSLYRSVSGIIRAIRSGAAAADIGGDAAKFLEALLGIDSIVSACF